MLCRRHLGGLVALACLFIAPASAASWWEDAARSAVRHEIRSQTEWSRVVFCGPTYSRRLSPSMVSVSGEGLASNRPGWGGVPFRYTVTLRRIDRRYTRLSVTFADGQVYRSAETWTDLPDRDAPDVHILSPRWYQVTHNSRVLIRGDAGPWSDLKVTLYARDGRAVSERNVKANARGQWSLYATLAPGNYRVTAVSGTSEDELRFAVRRQTGSWSNEDSGEWSWGQWLRASRGLAESNGLTIDAPRNGMLIKGPTVWLRGRSKENHVRINVEHGSHPVYRNDHVSVRRGRWAIRVVLKPGAHRVTVQAGARHVEVKFTVR